MDVAPSLASGVPEFEMCDVDRPDSIANLFAAASLRAKHCREVCSSSHTHILPKPQILPVAIGNVGR
jgi:hypothetical protein